MQYVVVGNGIAGITAIEAIRRLDSTSRITLIARETFPPYYRPIINLLLEETIHPRQIFLKDEGFYREFNVNAIIGHRVEELDVESGVVHTNGGLKIPFDKLLLATGAGPLLPSIDGLEPKKNVFFMRTYLDVVRIMDSLHQAKSALVIGGGLVGLKAACSLRKRGLKVRVVEKFSHLLPAILDVKAAGMVRREMERMGIEVIEGVEVKALEATDNKKETKRAFLSNGMSVDCDLVIVAVGVKPAISFVDACSVRINAGILVNEFLETNIPNIYAAGDVTEVVDIVSGERIVNPIWPEAAVQGEIAGANIAGRKRTYEGSLRRNVMRFPCLDILSGGMVEAKEGIRVIEAEDRRRALYRKLFLKDEVPVGVILVNGIEQGGFFLSLIKRGIPCPFLSDPFFDIPRLLKGGITHEAGYCAPRKVHRLHAMHDSMCCSTFQIKDPCWGHTGKASSSFKDTYWSRPLQGRLS